ncbi:hypothetical protein DAI22_07g224100 [Oryza sativa Japonica Group]|nr:hypothetical protein DAI22_07g224100 [Oryza sativa Japonica Group]
MGDAPRDDAYFGCGSHHGDRRAPQVSDTIALLRAVNHVHRVHVTYGDWEVGPRLGWLRSSDHVVRVYR